MSALDELLRSWRANPDAEATIALCTALGRSARTELRSEVRAAAERWHLGDARVMVRVGLMFLEAGEWVEAQAAFVSAGKADGRNTGAFRYLGEVLLRRGDAGRAEKVLERALRLEPESAELVKWHERARVYRPLQARVGMEAVAQEVARAVPSQFSTVPPPGRGREPASAGGRGAPRTGKRPATGASGWTVSAPAAPVPPPSIPPPRGPKQLASLPPPATPTIADGPATVPVPPPSLPPPSVAVVGARPPGPVPPPSVPPPAHPAPLGAGPAMGGMRVPPPSVPPPPNTFSERDGGTQKPTSSARTSAERATPSEVLDRLAQVGIFERQEGDAAARWERAPREKGRSLWVLSGAAVLVAAAAGGGTFYARQHAEQKRAEALEICGDVADALRSGDAGAIAKTDEQLSRAFDLDPNAECAARLWLENRVMHWMVSGVAEGIEGAIQRMRRLGMPPGQIAFGTIAVRLAEGDTPGALAAVPAVDEQARKDPLYQLLVGWALEKAGDSNCLDRYESALAASPQLHVARVFRARALLTSKGPEAVGDALDGIADASLEGRALRELGAALAPMDPKATPSPPVELSSEALPPYLKWIVSFSEARRAMQAQDNERSWALIGEALQEVDSPDAVVRVGELALAAGSPKLVRKAALQAITLSPSHVSARLLAARAALEMGQLEEALKALDGLDPKLADVQALRAVVAYERGDTVTLGDIVEAYGETGNHPAVPLLKALLVSGKLPRDLEAEKLDQAGVLWGRLVLADGALLRGDSKAAASYLATVPSDAPAVARRLAQLARVEGRIEEAEGLSAAAFEGSPTSLSLIERINCLLSVKQGERARELVEAHGSLLGPQASWLSVLIDVERGQPKRAKARAATIAEPPEESPLALRLAVVRALVTIGDRARGRPLLEQVRSQSARHPEVRELPTRL